MESMKNRIRNHSIWMSRLFVCIVCVVCLFVPARTVAQSEPTELTNLVIFVRFADDAEITHSFADIDSMFNGKTDGFLSVYNFFKALSYDKIHYNTVYTNNIQNGQISS